MNLRARAVRVVARLFGWMSALRRRFIPSRLALMEIAVGAWPALALRALVKTGVVDRLALGARTAPDLARDLGLDPASLSRVLRMLAGYGVVKELRGNRFALTRVGRHAVRDPEKAGAFIEYAGESWQLGPWQHLDETLRTGQPAFERIYGTTFFEYLRSDRQAAAAFDAAMRSVSAMHARAVVQAYDFGKHRLVADIGGGNGLLLQQMLQSAPETKAILFDLDHALKDAATILGSVADRARIEAGDFFHAVPSGADAYILSHVLHDWDDERATMILRTIAVAMPPHAHVFVVEALLSNNANVPDLAKITDVQMMAVLGGRERTREDFAGLFAAAGLMLQRVIPTAAAESILLGGRAGAR